MNRLPIVQCSTGTLAAFGGGRYFNYLATLEGIGKLAWHAVELRLWLEWGEGALTEVAARIRDMGVTVGSVHAPPETECFLSTAGHEDEARALLSKCAEAARACGAGTVVVHAWDLRRPAFRRKVLVDSVCRAAELMHSQGLTLSVENIPGHTDLLPLLAGTCPELAFTIDTQWTALEGSHDMLSGFLPRVNNVHVQTFVDTQVDNPLAVRLGRTTTGCDFDAEGFVRELADKGYQGLITLEPRGVPAAGVSTIRAALELLECWVRPGHS
ncbi:MAG TPA: TIM barrel protein [Firmicutes bacterium]|nr:TIM barrel protein [Candidatus Fermentithermobacillaceae bacterium]